jgi:hypothetical protein
MRVFRPVVLTQTLLVAARETQLAPCRAIETQLVGHELVWGIALYSCSSATRARIRSLPNASTPTFREGVRCWFAPHDLPWGAKTWDTIDEAIRLREKVLLILSKRAIASDWVEDEVAKAYAEERRRKQIVLFPVRLDNTVMKTDEPWASTLRDQRNIGDFTRWKDHDVYRKSFERLMRDLTV